jgi:hypothetical protein
VPSSKALLAVALAVDLGFAECRVIDGKEVLEDWKGEAKGSVLVQDSGLEPADEESRGAVADDDVAGGGCGGLLRAWDGGPGGGLAVVNRAMGGGDARNSNVSGTAKSKRL